MPLTTITCPHCSFTKDVDSNRLPSGASRIKCPKCQKSFTLEQTFTFEPETAAPAGARPEERPQPEAPDKGAPDAKGCPTCGRQLHQKAEICPGCGVRVAAAPNAVTKTALLLITFFLGGLGGHKFYQKKYWQGAIYLLFFWTYIPSLVALVEFIVYAFRSEADLQRRYPESSSSAIVFAVIVPLVGIALLGILAAIAIPQYQAYREKAYSAAARSDLRSCKTRAEAFFADQMVYPTRADQLLCQTSEGVALYYLSLGPQEFQIISFHGEGKTAFLAINDSVEIEESTRQKAETQLVRRLGAPGHERSFHFIE